MENITFRDRVYQIWHVDLDNVGLRFIASTDLNKQLVSAEENYIFEEA